MKTETLFGLIKSMHKTEKRYFKVQTARNLHDEQLQYVDLFDAMDSMKKYDVKQSGSFVYIQCEKTKDFNDFVKALNSKLKNYEGIRLRNLSNNENELKILNNLLVARIIGEVL